MGGKLDRHKVLSPDEVLPLILSPVKPGGLQRPTLHGVPCNTTGLRLFTFKMKGLSCAYCGIKGEFFAIERPLHIHREHLRPPVGLMYPFHLNLYAIAENGEEVLMTHDHIWSRGTGGRDTIDNTQTTCEDCNSAKSRLETRQCEKARAIAMTLVEDPAQVKGKLHQQNKVLIPAYMAEAVKKIKEKRLDVRCDTVQAKETRPLPADNGLGTGISDPAPVPPGYVEGRPLPNLVLNVQVQD